MCRICQHAHWSTEDHAWTGGAAVKSEPAATKTKAAAKAAAKPERVIEPGPIQLLPPPAVRIKESEREWRDRAIAAEAELAEIRRKQTERQQRLREKRKKVDAKPTKKRKKTDGI